MKRREFIAGLAASSVWQLGARAASAPRSDKIHRIGMLRVGYPPPTFLAPFRNGLHELGLVEGQNIFIEYGIGRSVEELPKLANDLIGLQVELLLASGTPAVIPAKNATTLVPIVFVAAIDPIATGLVQSLSRPGGNITGLTALFTDLMGKRLEFLQEAFPSISRVALISHINNPGHEQYVREAERAAKLLGITLQTLAVRGPEEFEQAFRGAQGAGAVLQIDDAMLTAHRVRLVELAMKYKIPGIYGFREFVDAGGFMALGPSYSDLYHRAAAYVDKILGGAKPADLPVEQPAKFEMIVNLKVGKQLGISISPMLLARADEVIE
jgi:putative tryptophan/tyrosine transport system substrate-binding protein